MLVVGLTGGIGSGKSTAARRFEELGVAVIDADVIAREVVEPGKSGFNEVVAAFGDQVVGHDGKLDRAVLRSIIFADAEQKMRLEGILHPKIYAEILQQLDDVLTPYCIVVIPLLAESKRDYPLDRVLVVDLPEALQVARTTLRDRQTVNNIEDIIRSQASRKQRLAIADDVVENSGTPEELCKVIDALHQQYLQHAKSSA